MATIMGDLPHHRWHNYDDRRLAQAEAEDIAARDQARAMLDAMTWGTRIRHLGRVTSLALAISNRNGMIRARRQVYGDFPYLAELDDEPESSDIT